MAGNGSAFARVIRHAGEAVGKFRLIAAGDRILAGASGGKDSFMLLETLHALRRRAPVDFTVIAATFDPGFPGFACDRIALYCRDRGWEHHSVRLPVGEIIAEKGWEKSPCVLCSRLRRGSLYGLAGRLGCNKLALGHHLDDLLASFLMSLCRGQGLTTMGPYVRAKREEVAVIRPLALTPEQCILEAREEFEFPQAGRCRYHEQVDRDGDRAYFKSLLARVEERIPHLKRQMLHSLERVETDHLLDPRFLSASGSDPEAGSWGRAAGPGRPGNT